MRTKDVTLSHEISKNIKKYREKLFPGRGGQQKCYSTYGADRDKWSRWERGAAVPTDPEQRRLAEFFGISLAELRGDHTPLSRNSVDAAIEKGVEYWRGQVDALKEENARLRQELDASRQELKTVHEEAKQLNREIGMLRGRIETTLEKPASTHRSIGSA